MKHPDIVSIATSAGALIAILSLMPVTANGQAAANDKAKANARPRGAPFLRQLTLFDRQGRVVGTVGDPAVYDRPVLSPDGTRLAAVQGGDIWLFDLSKGTRTQVTFDPAPEITPVWSPDGSQLAYVSRRGNYSGVYRKAADRTGSEELLYRHTLGASLSLTDWSSDGRFLGLWSGDVLYMLPSKAGGTAAELVRESFSTFGGRLSPDSRFYAYGTDESGQNQVYVRSFDSSSGQFSRAGGMWQISKGESVGMVSWRQDGQELYYLAADGGVMAVEVATTPAFMPGTPKLLFRAPSTIRGPASRPLGSVHPNGQRIVFAVPMPPERKEVTVAPEILAKYAGTYVLFGVDAVFTLEGNRLIRQWGQDPKEPLLAQSEKDFFFNNTREIEFVQDGTGRVTHLLFYQGGPAAKAPRK